MSATTCLFIVDPVEQLDPAHDTSVALIEQAQNAGHRVLVTTMGQLAAHPGGATATCREVRVRPAVLRGGRWSTQPDWQALAAPERRRLDDFDVIFVRTDPPVNQRYLRATYLLDLVDPAHTLIVNSPSGLRNANEKVFALWFPELCPDTVVTGDKDEILGAVEEWTTAVLKPTDGMAGRGVLLLRAGDPNLHSLLEVATARGRDQVVVQRYLPETSHGDRRVIVLGGEPIGAVRRIAAPGEFRCNMAAGAAVRADVVTRRDREICARIAPTLRAHGLLLAGIDVIGDMLIEINVTSPTGIREIEALSGVPLAAQIIAWCVEQRPSIRT